MPLLSSSSPVDAVVEKATNECNVADDWQQIMDLCDSVKTGIYSPKDTLKSIMKRVQHRVPHVSMQALALLGACVNNCGKPFHLEICSRDWTSEARHIVFKAHPKISDRLKGLIKQWTNEFKEDPQLSLMGKLYNRLKTDGVEFESITTDAPSSNSASAKKNDELGFKEDLDLAIALSLQDPDSQPKTATPSSLYPTMNTPSIAPIPQSQSVLKRVKALYDFEAVEDNELSFKVGELIGVLDDSDENWWKGENHRGVGLFPANFVTSNLSEPKPVGKKQVRFIDQLSVTVKASEAQQKPEISEQKLDLCLSMLKNASPTEEDDEEETIQLLELACKDMRPLLQEKIGASDKHKMLLEEIQEKFTQALSMYQTMMKEPIPTPMAVPPSYLSVQMIPQHHQPTYPVMGAYHSQPTPTYHQVGPDGLHSNRPPGYDQPVHNNMQGPSAMQYETGASAVQPIAHQGRLMQSSVAQQNVSSAAVASNLNHQMMSAQQQQPYLAESTNISAAQYYPQSIGQQNSIDMYNNTSLPPPQMYTQAPVYH